MNNPNYGMQYRPAMALQTAEERNMGMYLHLSALAGLLLPAAGIVLPIVLWQTQKDRMPALDQHGKAAVNWMISAFIYAIVSIPLMIVLVGFLTLFGVAMLSIIFPIIGAVKASKGELWHYPLAIKFLK